MGQINENPVGFLDLLKAKIGGRPPTVLSDNVAPVLDMTQFYMARNLSTQNYLQTTTVNSFQSVLVPPEEVWFLFNASFSYSTVANTNRVHAHLEVDRLPRADDPNNRIKLMSSSPSLPLAVQHPASVVRTTYAETFRRFVVLPPGVRISTTVIATDTLTLTLTTTLGIYRFSV